MDNTTVKTARTPAERSGLPYKMIKQYIALLLLFVLLPMAAMGQVNVTGTASTGYYLTTAEGDTLQLRGTTPYYSTLRIAYIDAMNYSAENYGVTVHLRSNMDERISADFGYYDEPEIIEIPGDTVYVDREVIVTETDTVFVELPAEVVYDTLYVETVVTQLDTVYVDNVIYETVYDTTYVDREVIVTETDTVFVELPGETIYDTTYVDREVVVTDTVYVDNIIYETVYDTVYVDQEVVVTDTVYVDLPADTVYVTETEYITEVDTVYVDQEVVVTDTVYVDNIVYETVYDTTYVDREVIVTDTVYVDQEVIVTETDTVYVEVPAERPVYEDLMVEARYRDTLPPYNIITTDVVSVADSLDIAYTCGTIVEGQYSTSAWNLIFSHTYDTECIENLTIDYTFWKDGLAYEATEFFPAFILQGGTNQHVMSVEDVTPWTQYWHMSSLLTAGTQWDATDTLAVEQPVLVLADTSSGSNVWINEGLGTTSEMEVFMRASTEGSTPHIRALATPYGYAQDFYYSPGLGGLQYAYWNNNDPAVPWSQSMYTLVADIPITGTGDYINMLLRIEANTVYIKAWFGEEPAEWTYTAPVAPGYENIEGYLGFGAHSVRTRYIEYLSVGLNGESAPRP